MSGYLQERSREVRGTHGLTAIIHTTTNSGRAVHSRFNAATAALASFGASSFSRSMASLPVTRTHDSRAETQSGAGPVCPLRLQESGSSVGDTRRRETPHSVHARITLCNGVQVNPQPWQRTPPSFVSPLRCCFVSRRRRRVSSNTIIGFCDYLQFSF